MINYVSKFPIVFALSLSSIGAAYANNEISHVPPVYGPCGTHVLMNFISLSGKWRVQALHANEIGPIVDINNECSTIEDDAPGYDDAQMIKQVDASHLVTPNHSFLVGYAPKKDGNEDFDTSLILTMVQQPKLGKDHLHPTKTCLFYIGAKGPAQAVTRTYEINGARCYISIYENKHFFKLEAQ